MLSMNLSIENIADGLFIDILVHHLEFGLGAI